MIARYISPRDGPHLVRRQQIPLLLNRRNRCLPGPRKVRPVSQSAADAIRDRSDFTVARINEIEAEVKHDVIAFTTT